MVGAQKCQKNLVKLEQQRAAFLGQKTGQKTGPNLQNLEKFNTQTNNYIKLIKERYLMSANKYFKAANLLEKCEREYSIESETSQQNLKQFSYHLALTIYSKSTEIILKSSNQEIYFQKIETCVRKLRNCASTSTFRANKSGSYFDRLFLDFM